LGASFSIAAVIAIQHFACSLRDGLGAWDEFLHIQAHPEEVLWVQVF
jgi:hypothetical protein